MSGDGLQHPVSHSWSLLAALGSKAVGAAELESETAPAAVLRRHLEAHVNGVGPAAAKVQHAHKLHLLCE